MRPALAPINDNGVSYESHGEAAPLRADRMNATAGILPDDEFKTVSAVREKPDCSSSEV